jgi:hypothetical protein
LAVDQFGTIYIGDGNAVRTIGGLFPIVRTISASSRGASDGALPRARFNVIYGLAVDGDGSVIVADSENRLVRRLSHEKGNEITTDQVTALRGTAEQFRNAAPGRWPYDPPDTKRDIAGTLGEIRGEMKPDQQGVWFHNGLDIAGAFGETARFVRDEKVLRPLATQNFGTLRELIRMPTMGYIHIRLGRDRDNRPFGDDRFLFSADATGKFFDVRVPRGASFKAGEPIGTLNPMNHVHLIAGRSGSEMNALDALILPGVADTRPPVIEKVSLTMSGVDATPKAGPIELRGRVRIVMQAYDQVDGNAARRRLGIYKAGYQLLSATYQPLGEIQWTIIFDRLPPAAAVPFVYADGSKSGATGETIFRYIVTDRVEGDSYREDFFDATALTPGSYVVRVFAADYLGNTTQMDTQVMVVK